MSSVDAKKRVFDLLSGELATTGFYGLSDLAANTDDLVGQIYVGPTYSDADRTKIASLLAGLSIGVRGEFPREKAQLPSVAILRASDDEYGKSPIGDYFGTAEDEVTAYRGAERYGTRFDEALELHIWAAGKGSRMLRDLLYLAVRELVLRGRRYLMQGGLQTPAWRDGRDGQAKRPEMEPHIVHAGYARLTYRAEMSWIERPERITAFEQNITGSHQGKVSVSPYLSEE